MGIERGGNGWAQSNRRQQTARWPESRGGEGAGLRRPAQKVQDIAVLTGGQAISEDLGIKLEKVTLDKRVFRPVLLTLWRAPFLL